MILKVNTNLKLELLNHTHANELFKMVDTNRVFLSKWLTFVGNMKTVEFAANFIKGCETRNLNKEEFAFVILENEKLIGRITIYKINQQNKIGEIGYWLVENKQGKGIITASCKILIDFCFNTLALNRIEIKCATGNEKSNTIPLKLNFKLEGVCRSGEFLNNEFVDLNVYSLLKKDVV